jgi:hypothetical protein
MTNETTFPGTRGNGGLAVLPPATTSTAAGHSDPGGAASGAKAGPSSLNQNGDSPGPDGVDVYQALTEHQLRESAWRYAAVIQEIHRYRDIFNREFDLDLPSVMFCVGYTRRNCYGYFRPGHNWFGVRHEILLKEAHVLEHIAQGQFWRVLGTVAHELFHAWQQKHGTPGEGNYHNAQLRHRAAVAGLLMDHRGFTTYEPGSPFFQVLDRYGVAAIALPEGVNPQPAATKHKKWVCGCQPTYGVRVAIAEFEAECLRCHQKFVLEAAG